MPYLIGTDEAGYAPNLGPLVISATAWEVDRRVDDDRLYEIVEEVVCVLPRDAHASRVAWADSKVLYSPGLGLAALERGMLAALGLIDQLPVDWRALWQTLDGEMAGQLESVPWHIGFNSDLPVSADLSEIEPLVAALKAGLAAAGIRLIAIASKAVFPDEFNRLVERDGNKAEVLSRLTLELDRANVRAAGSRLQASAMRQARRAKPLRPPAANAILRDARRSPRGRSDRERLCLGTEAIADRGSVSHGLRELSASGLGVDGLQISPRGSDAGIQSLLVSAPAGAAAHCRLSGRCAAVLG